MKLIHLTAPSDRNQDGSFTIYCRCCGRMTLRLDVNGVVLRCDTGCPMEEIRGAYIQDEETADDAILCLADVQPEVLSWMWEGWLPFGKLSLILGTPGLGKSLVCLDIAARLTTGRPMPGTNEATRTGNVVILSAEDALSDTVVPRLREAGADLGRVFGYEMDKLPNLTDIEKLGRAICQYEARLMVIDPMMAFIPTEHNSHQDQHIRVLLRPLTALAQKTGCAILMVTHPNKKQEVKAIMRSGGSIGIPGVCRSVFMAEEHPDDPDKRVLAPVKCNLAKKPASLLYHIRGEVGDMGDIPVVLWDGTCDLTADDLATASFHRSDRNGDHKAETFLKDILKDGKVESSVIFSRAREAGIPDRTLKRYKNSLGIKATKTGFGAGAVWFWELPAKPPDKECQPEERPVLRLSLASYGTLQGEEER